MNLQFLFLSIDMHRKQEAEFDSMLTSVIQSFSYHPLNRALKRLTFCIEVWQYSTWNDVVTALSRRKVWGALDRTLSKILNLQPSKEFL